MPLTFTPYNVKFKATQTIYQQQVICQVDENDFNYTMNPSAVKNSATTVYSSSLNGSTMLIVTGSAGVLQDFVTGSDFQPYVTTIGLYNETNDLLMVAKLAQPFRMPSNTDVNFIVRYDV